MGPPSLSKIYLWASFKFENTKYRNDHAAFAKKLVAWEFKFITLGAFLEKINANIWDVAAGAITVMATRAGDKVILMAAIAHVIVPALNFTAMRITRREIRNRPANNLLLAALFEGVHITFANLRYAILIPEHFLSCIIVWYALFRAMDWIGTTFHVGSIQPITATQIIFGRLRHVL